MKQRIDATNTNWLKINETLDLYIPNFSEKETNIKEQLVNILLGYAIEIAENNLEYEQILAYKKMGLKKEHIKNINAILLNSLNEEPTENIKIVNKKKVYPPSTVMEELVAYVSKLNVPMFGIVATKNTYTKTIYDQVLLVPERADRYYELSENEIDEINKIITRLQFSCTMFDLPMFVSIVQGNFESETNYLRAIWGPKSHEIPIAEDLITGQILVTLGFAMAIPETVKPSPFDEIVHNLNLTDNQLENHVKLTKGYKPVPPNEWLSLDMMEMLQ